MNQQTPDDQTILGFLGEAPEHIRAEWPLLFTEAEADDGKQRFWALKPIRVPGQLSPEEVFDDVARAGCLYGQLTIHAPEYRFGRVRYLRPGSRTEAAADTDDIRELPRDVALAAPKQKSISPADHHRPQLTPPVTNSRSVAGTAASMSFISCINDSSMCSRPAVSTMSTSATARLA